jgi:hypothetical protein
MILFFMGHPMHSGLAKATRGAAARLHQRGTFNANHVYKAAFQTLAAPQSAPSMPSEVGVVKPPGRYSLLQYGR